LGVLLATFGLIIPALYNGFPLVYSDTGAYIASGFQGTVPGDRPISYGLFVRHSSLSSSLWFTVITQALLLSLLLYWLFCKIWSEPKTRWKAFALGMFILISSSSISYFASMLLADVFAGISFLLLFLLLFDTPKKNWQIVLLVGVYLLVTSTHLTYAMIHLAVVTGMAFLKLIRMPLVLNLSWRKWGFGSGLVLLNFLFLPSLHYYHHGGFVSSKNGHLFITARMVESGAMKAVLDDACLTQDYALCAYKDSLPNNGSDFLWLPESVLYKIGGWDMHGDEYKELNRKIFLNAKYLQIYLRQFKRVALFHVGEHKIGEELIPMGLQTPPGWEIESHFKEELPQFLGAKQAQDFWKNKLENVNTYIFWVFIFSILVLLIYLVMAKVNAYVQAFIWCSFFMYLGNFLAVCISSSGSRYNARIDWLIVFMAIVILMDGVARLKRFAN
jgi:hypothetical protein